MHPLAEQIARFLQDERAGEFDKLSIALFEYQFAHNKPYRRLCEGLKVLPSTIRSWRDIPAVPAAAFKRFDLTCRPIAECPTVFYSSGTTTQEASRHWMDADALHLYETSLRVGYKDAIGGTKEIWALMPSAQAAPHSSLSHMLGALGAKRWFWEDADDLAEALRLAGDRSIALFGTAFYFVDYFDQHVEPIDLPTGSIIIETGGYKGRTREVPREELYRLFTERFGVRTDLCYGEYGMCEMASQFYSQGALGSFRGLHWVRTRSIDPISGQDACHGSPGLLRHYDLANFNSVMAIQTQDLGVIQPDGSFTLLGRAPQAEVRGCSLTVEELWSARK
jgi:hypothetical protein